MTAVRIWEGSVSGALSHVCRLSLFSRFDGHRRRRLRSRAQAIHAVSVQRDHFALGDAGRPAPPVRTDGVAYMPVTDQHHPAVKAKQKPRIDQLLQCLCVRADGPRRASRIAQKPLIVRRHAELEIQRLRSRRQLPKPVRADHGLRKHPSFRQTVSLLVPAGRFLHTSAGSSYHISPVQNRRIFRELQEYWKNVETERVGKTEFSGSLSASTEWLCLLSGRCRNRHRKKGERADEPPPCAARLNHAFEAGRHSVRMGGAHEITGGFAPKNLEISGKKEG